MIDKRQNVRYESFAKAIVEDISEEEALLMDISVTGCRIKTANNIEIKPRKQYRITIIPEEAAKVELFFLDVETKWAGNEVDSFEFGFGITRSPIGKQFELYIDYLSWRYSQKNSMIGDGGSEIL